MAEVLKGKTTDKRPAPNCLSIGMIMQKCQFLVVGGDSENPTFQCIHPKEKEKPRSLEDCDEFVAETR